MTKFNYIYFKKDKKLRILNSKLNSKLTVVFLHGLKSDMEGKKPLFLNRYCKKNKVNFLSLEYAGHGKSYGKFENGTISQWRNNVKFVIRKIIKKEKFLIVGSSLGAWLGLLQFQDFKKQIIGFIGIGSAPEFLDRLMWKKFPKKIKKEIIEKGVSIIKHGDSKFKKKQYEYPITHQLIKDGRKNKVFTKKIKIKIKVTMFHGQNDEVVPVSFSRKVLSIFPKAKKKLLVIRKGDHSLSQKKNLKKMIKELKLIVSEI